MAAVKTAALFLQLRGELFRCGHDSIAVSSAGFVAL
jgi:hypothetical protein